MKDKTKIIVAIAAAAEMAVGLLLYNFFVRNNFSGVIAFGVLAAWIACSLIADGLILHSNSASVVSDAKRLKDADDYIKAFHAWLNEDTPFTTYIQTAIKQLESLKRKQKALRAVLDDSKDSPFLSTANDVDAYVLANCKRILNRVMIFDQGEPYKYNMHVAYLQGVLGENAHVLSDFENLILEVSQIGDDATAATPCLNELTNALRSVRTNSVDEWDQPDQMPDPPQQMMMQ